MLGLAEVLNKAGHDVEIITYHNEDILNRILAGSEIKTASVKGKGTLGTVSNMVAHLKQTKCDALIAFLPGPSTKACLAHYIWPEFKLYVSERAFVRRIRLRDRLRMFIFREADRIICNNYAQEEILHRNFPELRTRLLTICNFVNPEDFKPKTVNRSGSVIRFVVTARVKHRKNPKGLIRAAAILKEKLDGDGKHTSPVFRIDWYGSASNRHYFDSCIHLIEKFNLTECFEFHDSVNDVASVYHNADVFCLPSFYEGTSNSLAEALASGLPVICSAIGDNMRFVRDNGFLFNPADPSDIAEAMYKMTEKTVCRSGDATGSCTWRDMGRKSREIAEELLSPERFEREYIELLSGSEKKQAGF